AQRLGVPLLATPSTTVSPPPEAPAEPEASASPEVRPAAQQPAAQQPAPQQPAAQQDSNGSEELLAEIERLAARTLVTVGDAAHAWATGAGLPADGPTVLTHVGVES